MNMEYINKGLVEKATAVIPQGHEEVGTVKGVLAYLLKVVFGGEHYEIMLLLAAIIIILSLKNYYGAKSTGQPLENHESSFFVILCAVAAIFHAIDLFWSWSIGHTVLLVETRNPVANFLFAILLGITAGAIILIISIIIRKIKAEQIERKAFYKRLHHLGRKK